MNAMIRWMAENRIAADLLMLFIVVGGLTSLSKTNKEVFPQIRINEVQISIPYRGAGPREVEQQICLRVEEALEGLDGMDELRCVASTELAVANVVAETGFPLDRLLNSVKTKVDAISTFPTSVERPIIEEVVFAQSIVSLMIYGNASEVALKELGESIREELLTLSEVPKVRIRGARDYELAVEVSEANLQRYNMGIDEIAAAIRGHSVTLPGGNVETSSGEIQIQARNQAYTENDFAQIPVRSNSDGSMVPLSDIATIIDGFEEDKLVSRFNGLPAVFLQVETTQNPNILKTVAQVKEYVEQKSLEMPENIQLEIWQDESRYYRSRLDTLVRNGSLGLALVFLLLMIFLRPRVALWVAVGIAVAFIGALFMLPFTGLSLSIMSLFAFIMVLGIVVDDAIIIGENVHRHQEKGRPGLAGAIRGTIEMGKPVFFAVTTSIVVFIPMLYIPGDLATFLTPIAVVPMLALSFSLIESLLILPAHLSNMPPERPVRQLRWLDLVRDRAASSLRYFLITRYRPFLRRCMKARFLTLSCFCAAFLLCITLIVSGIVKISITPDVQFENIVASVEVPQGTPFSELESTLVQVQEAARKASDVASEKYGRDIVENLFLVASGNRIEIIMETISADILEVDTTELTQLWRQNMKDLYQAEKITIISGVRFNDSPVEFELTGANLDDLEEGADWLASRLSLYPGMFGVEKSLRAGRSEMEVIPRPEASQLGLTLQQISSQTRQVFFGEEAQRIPRGREDVRVMVRYPKVDRERLSSLDRLRIRTTSGDSVPLDAVADTRFVPGYASISRIDGRSIIQLTSEFDANQGESVATVVADFIAAERPEFEARFPSLTMELAGEQLENKQFLDSFYQFAALAVLAIYALLAIQFKSWWQPGLIISAIPFGFAGAVIVHFLKGDDLNVLSFFGVMAAAGVVVNDTLVLIDRANVLRRDGFNAVYAIIQAGRDRFRPIMLTSITTFVGLTPIMLETSVQAKFLIPMALSLAFGVMAASIVTLIMVPCAYSLWDELIQRWSRTRQQDAQDTTLSLNQQARLG